MCDKCKLNTVLVQCEHITGCDILLAVYCCLCAVVDSPTPAYSA